MPSSTYPNSTQYDFLKKLRDHAHGVPVDVWPNPATLKRWMRRRTFRRAFRRLMETLRREADYVAASAATRAAHGLHRVLGDIAAGEEGNEDLGKYDKLLQQYLRILRMDQQRQRDRRAGELALTRTPAYLDRRQRRKDGRRVVESAEWDKARNAEFLLDQLKKYRDLVDVPLKLDACISKEMAASIHARREENRQELERKLLSAGLLPPGTSCPSRINHLAAFDSKNRCP